MQQNNANTPKEIINTDSLPLYKRLDLERTQGEWKAIDLNQKGFPSVLMTGTENQYRESYGRTGFTMNVGGYENVLNANAQIIPLAVNNVAKVADALQKAVDFEDSRKKIADIIKAKYIEPEWVLTAKAALKAIS